MPTPFRNLEDNTPVELVDCEGSFGCFESGCGRVVGFAKYNEQSEMLFFTCPSGHKNQVNVRI